MFWKILLAIFAIFVILMALLVTVAILEAFYKFHTENNPDRYENND